MYRKPHDVIIILLQFSIVEAVFVSLMDEFPDVLRKTPYRPVMLRAAGCCIFFLITIPMVCNVCSFKIL